LIRESNTLSTLERKESRHKELDRHSDI